MRSIKKKGSNVAISYTKAFKLAIIDTLEKLLSVKRDNLTQEKADIFDNEVQVFYSSLPTYWRTKPVRGHRWAFLKVLFSKIKRFEHLSCSKPETYLLESIQIDGRKK